MSQFGNQVLIVNAIGATFEKDGQKFGKQDPYAQFTVNLADKNSIQKTYTHKDGGKNPQWNQSFTIDLHGEPDLFVQVLDEENMAPALIGFAAIPINQVVYAQGAAMNAVFELYDIKNNVVGEIHLVLQAQGFQNSSNQQPQGPVRGQSYVNEQHLQICKSIRNKEHASEVGGAILGGALAIGAGLLGKKLYDDHKKDEEEDRQRQEDEERRQQEFNQREEELKRREEEYNQRQQHQGGHNNNNHGHDHGHNHGHHHNSGGAREWDPVGSYAAGDRVEYHGRTYLCLQGHTSNPTWKPTDAHSLWESA